MRSITKVGCIVLVVIAMAGCGARPSPDSTTTATPPATVGHGGPVHDHVSFVDRLRANGVRVEIMASVSRPFLRAKGTQLRLTGDGLSNPAMVESYNYDSTDLGTDATRAANDDAAAIAPDGTPKSGAVKWNGPVHFFRADRVLVLYAGSDPAAVKLLTDMLGPQFAGT
jgi:hypothetical protein